LQQQAKQREADMAKQWIPDEWIGQRIELTLEGHERPRIGTLTNIREDGVELAEEVYPDPYGEGKAEQASPTFYGYDSIVDVRRTEEDNL
jgi:hypothetical protein